MNKTNHFLFPGLMRNTARTLRMVLSASLLAALLAGMIPLQLVTQFASPALAPLAQAVAGRLPQPTVASANTDPTLCYAVADDGDRLVTINRITGGNFTDIGSLGATAVEAIAWNLDATILYAANAGTFGTINISTGAFTSIGSFGSGTGTETPSGDGNVSFSDVDGLGIDPTTGIMYGTVRNGDGTTPDDVLIQINLSTGAHINDAFGAGKDFVSINTSTINATLNDVDDIAVDPTDGQMYAVANNSGGNDRLVKVNKATGVVTDVGLLRLADNTPVEDMEGFSFYNDGTFYGTTGNAAAAATNNRLWQIDPDTGIVTLIGAFTSYGDYEAVACLTGGSNKIEGTAFEDVNANGAWNPGTDSPTANVTVSLYRDSTGDGNYDTLVDTTTSATDGSYSFEVALSGDFKVVVGTMPAPTLSTPGDYEITFTDFGNTSSGNDFGYVTSGSIGNYIWLDLDRQGDQDAGEPGIPGIVVELQDGSCTPGTPGNPPTAGTCTTVTTDEDGLYSFPGLNLGTYTVNVLSDMSAYGLTQTYDPDEGAGTCSTCNGNDADINLAQGQVYNTADLGYRGSASIGDFVWDDAGNDGGYDVGEAGLSGVTVNLTWYGPDGTAGGGDDVSFTTASDGSGSYDFTGLPSGNYSVDLDGSTAPAGYVLTTGNDPLAVTLTTGQDYNTADFGLYKAPEATKQLYFTEAGQGLDRISPVDTNDTTTATSGQLSVPKTSYQVRDEFNGGIDYTGNDGTDSWADQWRDVGDTGTADDPNDGKIVVAEKPGALGVCVDDGDYCVDFKTWEVANTRYIYRAVDMSSALGSATFSFDYYYKLDDAAAKMEVQYSCDGGSSWTTFPDGTFGPSDTDSGSFSKTIPCTTSNTRIRFVSTGTKKDKTFVFDDVDISWTIPATPDTETFTQGAALVDDLTLPANGEVKVSAYLDVTSGFIDLTQSVSMEAKVRYGGSTLLTLSNPTVTALLPPILNDVEDTFPVKGQYDGNSGSANWSNVWQEELDGGDPGAGDIKVNDVNCPSGSGNCLEIKANNVERSVYRTANLTGAVSAILTYSYNNLLERKSATENDVVVLEVSKNGGVSYTTVATHSGDENGENDSNTVDITAYASANTSIRFRVAGKGGAQKLFVDDVNITYGVDDKLYLATWTGTVPSNTTIPSGSAIAVDIISSVGGTNMNVLYDSTTRPSQLNMTVSSFINIDSLGIYDAAYSGGSVVTESEPGDTVYIRATVSDPFGAADITDLDLGITDIGCGSVDTTLSSPVASSASTKTFEYVWNVGSCEGDYLVSATANEGTEGVTARKAIPFAVVRPATIGNRVWLDEDGDGVQDAGEDGIANATVELVDGSNNVVATTRTGADGGYLFTDVTPGTYTVRVVSGSLPSGLAANPTYDENGTGTAHVTSVTVAGGDEHLTADFGYNWVSPTDNSNPPQGATGAIGDRVWNDANGDGVQDRGESGLGGVTVKIYHDPDGNGVYDTLYTDAVDQDGNSGTGTTTTEADGSYVFHNLPPGGYVIEVNDGSAPTGFTQSGDPDGVLDSKSTSPIVVAPGDVFVNADFGYRPDTGAGNSIGDRVWLDADADGVQDSGEAGIPGVEVKITWYGNDGTLGTADDVVYLTTTDFTGAYLVDGLPDGNFQVTTNTTGNLATGAALNGLTQTYDSDGTATTHTSTVTGLGVGVDAPVASLTEDFGYSPTNPSTTGRGIIGDTIFFDANSNGVPDPGEGIPGVKVTVSDGTNTYVTYTDANGNWYVGDLPVGTYTVTVDPTTLPGGGSGLTNTIDPDGGTANQSSVTLSANMLVDLKQDFGYTGTNPLTNSIGDTVWLDADRNGSQGAGEPGIPGVTVQLTYYGTDGVAGGGDDVVYLTTTDENGHYLFENLPDGNYSVTTVLTQNTGTGGPLAGLSTSYDKDGTTSTPDGTTPVTLASGDQLDVDFGYSPSDGSGDNGVIGDTIFFDANGNGVPDPGEGLAGVKVTLDGSTVTYTDANGNYTFGNLAAGNHTVVVDTTTLPGGGTSFTNTVDPDGGTANQSTVNLATNSSVNLEQDFGYQTTMTGSIGNTVWLDADVDGVQDAGEPGIAGVTVALIQDSNANGQWDAGEPIIATTATNENGAYGFTGLSLDDGGGDSDADYLVWVNDTENALGELVATYDADGTNPSTGLQSGLGISAVALSSGTPIDNNQDFGYAPEGHSTGEGLIGDTVFLDTDGSGGLTAGEGVEGVTVNLYDAAGTTLVDTTTTDKNGNYTFGNLVPTATYTVKVDTTTLPSGGTGLSNTIDPDGNAANESVVNLSTTGGINLSQDFGYTMPSGANTIGGTIWEDKNADGTLNEATPNGLAGVTVVLRDSSGDIVATATTDANGGYSFTNLPNGSYTVDVTDEANVLAGYWHSDGPNDGSDNNSQVDPYTVSVTGGQTNTTADFGYYKELAAVGNTVWVDDNNDGLQDELESGLDGVVVKLTITYPNNDTAVITTVTGDDPSTPNVVEKGWYSFGNLLADEDYNGAGGSEPTFTITMDTSQSALAGLDSTVIDVAGNSKDAQDADYPASTTPNVVPVQGVTDTSRQGDPTAEPAPAHTDFGLYCDSDWGDLPDDVATRRYPTLLPSRGGRHCIVTGLHLGTGVDKESNGKPHANAAGDSDEGVNIASVIYNDSTKVFTIEVTVVNSTAKDAQLVGWIDFNENDKLETSERSRPALVNGTGGAGDTTFTTGNIPASTSGTVKLQWTNVNLPLNTALSLFSRFRLSYDPSFFSDASPEPDQWVNSGEVEDFEIPITTLPVTVSYVHAERRGGEVLFTWQTSTETASAGFKILVETPAGLVQVNPELIPSKVIDSVEPTDYSVKMATDATIYYLQEMGINGEIEQMGPFTVGLTYGSTVNRFPGEKDNLVYLPIVVKR